jgi:threonine/homoserine/homoserine lactone efflux protein
MADGVRNHVISRPRVMAWMRRSFAAAFLALGVKLAFADR